VKNHKVEPPASPSREQEGEMGAIWGEEVVMNQRLFLGRKSHNEGRRGEVGE